MITFDINKIPFDDKKTWNLICSGHTRGIFQLESPLSRHWIKKVKPGNVWELSLFLALLRPGALQSNMMEDYIDYKDGRKEYEPFGHPIIDSVFSTTGGILAFQESIMALGTRLAWPDADEKQKLILVDKLRKSIGKKSQKDIHEIGKVFVDGCIRNDVDQSVADKLFEIIKNCGRYLFNLSHSMSYAHVSYKTAYLKCHYPLQFVSTYLSYAKFKQAHKKNGKEIGGKWGEIKDFVQESKILGIEVLPPNVNSRNEHFCIENGAIRYGLSHIKYFGGSIDVVKDVPVVIKDWRQVLALCCTKRYGKQLKKTAAEALIVTGAFSDVKISRMSLLNAFKAIERLSPKEMNFLFNYLESQENYPITDLGKAIIHTSTQSIPKRVEILKSEGAILDCDAYDDPTWVELQEQNYLGCSLTTCAVASKVSDNIDKCISCIGNLPDWTKRSISVVIDEIRYTVTKRGQTPGQRMCFLRVHDETAEIEKLPVFPEKFVEIEDILMEKNIISLTIVKGKGGWFIESAYQL